MTKRFVLLSLGAFFFAPIAFAHDVDIRSFGAEAKASFLNTEAIQRAIDSVSASGGGRVVIAGGVYVTGTLHLKDGVELHLAADAVLQGSANWRDWKDVPNAQSFDHKLTPRGRSAALIIADGARHIALTGRGAVDANGLQFVRPVADRKEGQPYERILDNAKSPPRVMLLAGCQDVIIRDFTLRNLPAGWGVWIHNCDRVKVDGVTVSAAVDYPNNDGLHVNCSRDVAIANCHIETGDDAIVVRANSVTLKENRPCERVTVANCSLRSYANAIRIGWANDGVIRNCTFTNLAITDSVNGIGIVLPETKDRKEMTDQGREATLIENIRFSNIVMDRMLARPVQIEIDPCVTTRCAAIRNIVFSGMSARGLEFPLICGREGDYLENIAFRDCQFEKRAEQTRAELQWRLEGYAFYLRRPGARECAFVRNLSFSDVLFRGNDDSVFVALSRGAIPQTVSLREWKGE